MNKQHFILLELYLFMTFGLIVNAQQIFEYDEKAPTVFEVSPSSSGLSIMLHDSLPDGIYILYTSPSKGLLKKSAQSQVKFKGEIKDSMKTGTFEYNNYCKFNKDNVLCYSHIIEYYNDKKHGIEKEYSIIYYSRKQEIVMNFLGQYFKGMKQGIFQYFYYGDLIRTISYDNDTIENIYLNSIEADYILGEIQ